MADARDEGLSLVARVMLVVTLALVSGAAGVAWLVFRTVSEQTEHVFDGQLAQTAGMLIALTGNENPPERSDETDDDGGRHVRASVASEPRFKQRIVYQVWSRTGPARLLARSARAPETMLPVPEDGFSDLEWDERDWRFYRIEQAGRIVIVGQDARVRSKLAREVGEHGFGPLVAGFFCSLLLAWAAIALGLRPLSRLAREVRARAPERLDPLGHGRRPRELAVLVGALDGLFAKVARAFANERRFTADAAHELRTPLAALTARIQSLQTACDAATREARLTESLHGLRRMARLVEQLLAVARLDALETAKCEPIAASEKVREIAAELAPAALKRGVELALDAPEPVVPHAQPDLLRAALRNLIDNAIRHSPPGAVVDILIRGGEGMFVCEVRDSGCGVAEPLRQRLGERFLRGDGEEDGGGAGLGLSIVLRVAELHGGCLEFEANRPQGLVARLILPLRG